MADVHETDSEATDRRASAAMANARRRVAAEPPFSPSWDAAMAALEELERRGSHQSRTGTSETAVIRATTRPRSRASKR